MHCTGIETVRLKSCNEPLHIIPVDRFPTVICVLPRRQIDSSQVVVGYPCCTQRVREMGSATGRRTVRGDVLEPADGTSRKGRWIAQDQRPTHNESRGEVAHQSHIVVK